MNPRLLLGLFPRLHGGHKGERVVSGGGQLSWWLGKEDGCQGLSLGPLKCLLGMVPLRLVSSVCEV